MPPMFALLVLATLAPFHLPQEPKPVTPIIPPPDQILKTLKPGHPRLLADNARFAEIGRLGRTDPLAREWLARIRAEGEGLLTAEASKYVIPDGLRLLATSRRVLDRLLVLGMLWRLDRDRRWADRAWAELEAAARFPDWNPRHFLDTAEMTHAFAIGYDWLYDAWTPEQRTTLRDAIIRHGFTPGLRVYRQQGWWSVSEHNWNQVCNGGLGMGALAIGDEAPAESGEILHEALKSLPRAMKNYGPDGAWAEGPGYWNYATKYNVAILAGLETALGTDFGLSRIPGFSLCGLFPIYSTAPTGESFNYADSGSGPTRAPEMWWLARRFGNPAYSWYARKFAPGTPLDLVWYDPKLPTARPANLSASRHFRGSEVVMMRSAWDDPAAWWVGFKAGDNKANHSHLDLGSFLLEASGVRWALDLGADNYNLPGFFGLQRWTYYRLRAEGNNTIVYAPQNGPDQDPRAVAPIVRYSSTKARTLAIADLTQAYARAVQSAKRGILFRPGDRVTLQDEMASAAPVEAWWFMHTRAEIQLTANARTAILSQGGQRLLARIAAPAQARFQVMAAAPLPTSPNPEGQNRNADFRKLAVHLPGQTNLTLVIELVPLDGERQPPPIARVLPLDSWR